ncbi:MAG: InlB B-repeat-containing protein [Clostridiales bacterium]|nr:InlB B-repeat-containing protein [Clostridiales bacterium]
MKKRNLLLLLLTLVCVVSMAFGFAACDNHETFTVTYVAGGGTGDIPSGASYKAGEQFTVAANTFVREGYTFTAWSDGEKNVLAGSTYTMPARNVVFTAQWEGQEPSVPSVTFTFDHGYDNKKDVVDNVQVGTNYTFGTDPIRSGYRFLGWKAAGSETLYKQGDTYNNVTVAMTFTAQWIAQYKVTFDLGEYDGTESAPAAITKDVNTSVELPEVGVTWDNHTFLGWQEEGADGEPMVAGSEYTVTKNVTLVAQWQDDTPPAEEVYTGKVTVNSTMGGGSITIVWMKVVSVTAEEATFAYKLENDEEEYTITGDGTMSDRNNGYYVKFGNVTAPKAFIKITEDELIFTTSDDSGDLVGKLTKGGSVEPPVDEEYTVTFMIDYETVFTTVVVKAGEKVSAPNPAPTHESKTFHHWATVNGDEYDFDTPVTANLTLEASFWILIRFDIGDAEGNAPADIWSKSYRYNVGALPDSTGFSKDGYTLKGWSDGSSVTAVGVAYGYTSASITFTAVWESTSTNPPAQSEWVEFTGEVDVDTYGDYYLLSPIVWVKIDVNGVDTTLTYKVKGDNTVYTAKADPDQNDGTKLYYILSDFGPRFGEPRIFVEVNEDHDALTLYDSQGNECGTLTVGGEEGPVDPPVGESKSIVFGHASNAPEGAPDSFPELQSGVVGEEVTIPEIAYNVAHYTFNGWNVYKLVNGDWESDSEFSRIADGGSFIMPNYAIKLVSNFTVNYVTIKFDSNGGSGEMDDITGTYRYNSSYSIMGNKFQNKFTGPNGAEFLYWSTKADGSYKVESGDMLTEEYGVSEDDILILYAIWDDSNLTPEPDDDVELSDYEGVWTKDGGKITIMILEEADGETVGYAYISITADGIQFNALISLQAMVDYIGGTDYNDETQYIFFISQGALYVAIYVPNDDDEDDEYAWTAQTKNDLTVASESVFVGSYSIDGSSKVLWRIDEHGVALRDNGFSAVEIKWFILGEYAVIKNSTMASWYVLASGTSISIVNKSNLTVTAIDDLVKLTVDGVLNQLVANGSALNAGRLPTEKDGATIDHWENDGAVFDVTTPLTEDVELTSSTSSVGGEEPENPPVTEPNKYTGGSFTIKISVVKSGTVTAFTFNEDFTMVTLYMSDGSTKEYSLTNVTGSAWLKGDAIGVAVYEMQDASQFSFYFSFTDDSKSTVKVCNEDYELLDTFTKEGSTQGGGEEEDNPPTPTTDEYTGGSFTIKVSAVKSGTVTSFTFNDDFTMVTLHMNDGSTKEYSLKNVTGSAWLKGDANGVVVYEMQDANQFSFYFSFTDDSKSTVKVCNEDYELLDTFTKA